MFYHGQTSVCDFVEGNHPGPLRHRCERCQKAVSEKDSIQCEKCCAVRYCCAKHQRSDREEHAECCDAVQKAVDKVARARDSLLAIDAEAFKGQRYGYFWRWAETRTYMIARNDLCNVLFRANTLDGIRRSLDDMNELLRMSRQDRDGLRDIMVCMMIRLDKDQECFDFIKWWERTSRPNYRFSYNWSDARLPYLNLDGSSLLTSISFLDKDRTSLRFLVSAFLLKTKVAIDIKNIRIARRTLHTLLFAELIELVVFDVIRSPISRRFVRMSDDALTQAQDTLCAHVVQLGSAIARKNHLMIEALFRPRKYIARISIRQEGKQMTSLTLYDEVRFIFEDFYPAIIQFEEIFPLLERAAGLASSADSEAWTFVPQALKQMGG